MQKLNSRKAALLKTKAVSEEEKPSLRDGLLPCLMSSEESEDDGTFTVRPLLGEAQELQISSTPWMTSMTKGGLLGAE